jgi:hypothetical protein
LESQARPWWTRSWVYGFAVASAALLVLLAVWPRGPVPVAPRMLASIPAPPLVVATAPTTALKPEPRPRRELALLASAHREPVTVKLQTSNPNIVIYWIAD